MGGMAINSGTLIGKLGYALAMNKSAAASQAQQPKDVNFYDYDGTLLYSCTLEEARSLAALPDGPTHDGLTFQKWNRDLASVNALTRGMNVGAMYTTDDGKTRLYFRLEDIARPDVTINFTAAVDGGVTIDWGDGSAELSSGTSNKAYTHTYTAVGDYVITLDITSGTASLVGAGTSSGNVVFGGAVNGAKNMLQRVEVGQNVTSIGGYAFQNCYSLTSITIPDGVTSIGSSAFYGCTYAKEYHLLPTTPPTLSDTNAFTSIASDCIIYVPADSLDAYQSAANWSTYADYMQGE